MVKSKFLIRKGRSGMLQPQMLLTPVMGANSIRNGVCENLDPENRICTNDMEPVKSILEHIYREMSENCAKDKLY